MLKKVSVSLSAALVFFLISLNYITPLFYGEKNLTVYTGSASSEALAVVCEGIFPLNRYGESYFLQEGDPAEIMEKYSAKEVFKEEIEEGVSYYAYSDKIKYLKIINGKRVNLHVFVGKDYVAVGSPVIFGSF